MVFHLAETAELHLVHTAHLKGVAKVVWIALLHVDVFARQVNEEIPDYQRPLVALGIDISGSAAE